MPIAQKRAWAMMVVSALAYVVYVVLVVTNLQDPVSDTPYVVPLLGTIGGSVAATVLAEIGFAVSARREGKAALRTDERDRDIDRFGNHVGQAFIVIGAIAALIMAVLQWPYFWIANVIYLAFVLSAVLGSAARLAAYRQSFQPW
jgi:hypothetical protein